MKSVPTTDKECPGGHNTLRVSREPTEIKTNAQCKYNTCASIEKPYGKRTLLVSKKKNAQSINGNPMEKNNAPYKENEDPLGKSPTL